MNEEYEKFCFLQNQIFKILNELDEKDRYSWTLSLAANFLHDIPAELRKEFFENYEKLRMEVNKIYGEKEER